MNDVKSLLGMQKETRVKRSKLSLFCLISLVSGSVSAQSIPDTLRTVESTTTQSIAADPVLASSLALKTELFGTSKEDSYANSKYAGGALTISGEGKFTDVLSGRLGVFILLTEGSYSNRYSESDAPPNMTVLDEAIIEYRPHKILALQAGIVTTTLSPFSSTLYTNGFPGAKETLTFENDSVKASLMAMQTMPVSGTATVKNTEPGVTSTFMAYGGEITTNPHEGKGLTLQGSVAYFEFNNLTTSAAIDSQGKGNTIIPGKAARFQYGFAGTEVGVGTTYEFDNSMKIKFGGTLLNNELAPTQKNKGYIYSTSFSAPMFYGEGTVTGGYLYNESDTLPAAYTTSSRGFNNRFGPYGSIKHSLTKSKLTTYIRYFQLNEIEDRPKTDDRTVLSVGLEVPYDIL